MITTYYKPGRSLLHRFDPRTKLVVLLGFLAAFFLPLELFGLALYLFFICLVTVGIMGIKELLLPLRLILPVLILVLLLTPPFYRGGSVFIAVRGFPLFTTEGIYVATRLIIRFLGISLVFSLYLRSTDPDMLVLSLRWFGLPYSLALITTIAFRYIPFIDTLYHNVLDAHKLRRPLRGRKRTGFFKRLLERIPVLTSVMIQSIRTIPILAMALETRGFGRANARTSFLALKPGRSLFIDLIVTVTLILLITLNAMLFQ
jgi:energy-coupling factor transport system permease protein